MAAATKNPIGLRTYWYVEHKHEAVDRYHPREIDENGVMDVYIGEAAARKAMFALTPSGEDPARWGNLRIRSSTFDKSDAIRIQK